MKIIDTFKSVLGFHAQQPPHPLQQRLGPNGLARDSMVLDGAYRRQFPVVPNPEPVQPPAPIPPVPVPTTPVPPTPNPEPVEPPTPILPDPAPEPLRPTTPIAPAPTPHIASRPPLVCDGLSRRPPSRS